MTAPVPYEQRCLACKRERTEGSDFCLADRTLAADIVAALCNPDRADARTLWHLHDWATYGTTRLMRWLCRELPTGKRQLGEPRAKTIVHYIARYAYQLYALKEEEIELRNGTIMLAPKADPTYCREVLDHLYSLIPRWLQWPRMTRWSI